MAGLGNLTMGFMDAMNDDAVRQSSGQCHYIPGLSMGDMMGPSGEEVGVGDFV